VSRPVCEIVVQKPVLVGSGTVRYALRPARPAKKYFSHQPMVATYDVDVGSVPMAILLVPFVATVAPIAWALGAELRVPVADTFFLKSLDAVRQGLERLYPAITWSGRVCAEEVVDCRQAHPGDGVALLFSGGVDSHASFVLHRDEKPRLISVWGADVGLRQRDAWEEVAAANREFARRRSVPISFIETNFRTFFNHYKLRARFFGGFPNWYSAAQLGLGLTALCAPLSWVHGLARVLISSAHAPDANIPWGLHPEIDGNVRWAATEVVHDGAHLGRQMKLGIVADYIRDEDLRLDLRVCWGRGSNCCGCTKCCLTMVGLALAGLDPNDHGFRFDPDTRAHIGAALAQGRIPLSDADVLYWREIQREIARPDRPRVEALEDFFVCLQGMELSECQPRHRGRAPTIRRFLETRPEPAGRWIRTAIGHPFP
jgi:hypothetical protein